MKTDFEITQDKEFLKYFLDYRETFLLSPEMVDKLSQSKDPYGVYGYGQWLYRVRPDGGESLKKAQKCFEYASMNGIADAKQMLSVMSYYGDIYNEDKGGIWEKDDTKALILNSQAQAEGSELAKIRNNIDLFWGNIVPADRRKAISDAEKQAAEPGASLLWMEQLGYYYETEDRIDEAIKAYEKCIEEGLDYPIYDLAFVYFKRGNIAYYESLMEEGIRKEIPMCMIWGIEKESEWDELSPEQQQEIHQRLDTNLHKGIEMGAGICAYILALYKIYGLMGFEKDLEEGMRIASRGVDFYHYQSCGLILDLMETDGIEYLLPPEMILSDEEKALLELKALRYGDDDRLESLVRKSEKLTRMGYGDEMRHWTGRLEEIRRKEEEMDKKIKSLVEQALNTEKTEKTEIVPTILIIQPSGFTDFVEADIMPMSFREMGALIEAEGLDAVHFSNPLNKITRSCGLKKNVTMYVDRDADMKGLEDNAVASILYDRNHDIRGAVIIAMEDHRYDTYSFDTEEDIENVYEAIDELTGGLLRRDLGQSDGQYDPWA